MLDILGSNKHALVFASIMTLAVVSAPVAAQAQLSGTQEQLREILFPRPEQVSIEGSAELNAAMDSAVAVLQVTTQDRSLEQAMIDNQALRQQLSQEFIAAGIDPDTIYNAKFSSTPQSGFFSSKTNSYEVGARLQLKIQSETHLQLLAAAADEHEEVELGRISFEHSERQDFEQRARTLALQDAMAKSRMYAQALGLTLTPVNFFSNSYSPRAQRQDMMLQRSAAAMSEMSAAPAPSNFDSVDYRASATVTFAVSRE